MHYFEQFSVWHILTWLEDDCKTRLFSTEWKWLCGKDELPLYSKIAVKKNTKMGNVTYGPIFETLAGHISC